MRSTLARAVAAGVGLVTLAVASSVPAVAAPTSGNAMTELVAGSMDVVINEFAPSGPGGSADEFVELRNTSGQTVVLDGWELAVCLSSPSPLTLVVFGATDQISAGEYLVLANFGFARSGSPDLTYSVDVPDDGGWLLSEPFGGSDGVGLRSVLACTEGSPAPGCDWDNGESVSRDKDGTDTDDNATDFACQPPTPGF